MQRILILFIGLTIFQSCKKVDEFTQFDMVYKTSVDVPATEGVALPINLTSPEVETNSSTAFSANDTRMDLIEEIRLEEMNLRVTAPADGNLDYLKSITIYIQTDGQDEQRIAWKENVPDKVGSQLELETTDKDLKAHLKAENFKLRISTTMDEPVESEHTVEIRSVFHVDAEVLGQ